MSARSWLLGALPLGLGCSGLDDQTCEIPTAEISAVAQVVDSGYDIRAAIDFEHGDRRGTAAPLELCETDTLTIAGLEPVAVAKASRVEYAVDFEFDAERRFEFVLDREDQGEQIAFELELPAAFEITTPAADAPLQIGEPQVVQWEPAGEEGSTILVGLTESLGGGQCLVTQDPDVPYEERLGVPVPDTGQWTVKAGELGSDSIEPCPATYTLTRLTLGEYPTNFERGGRLEARVERYRDVLIQP